MNIHHLDPINLKKFVFDLASNPVTVESLTVRGLKKLLEDADPDAPVIFLAEMTPQLKDVNIVVGPLVCMADYKSSYVILMGPEGMEGSR